MAGDRSFRSLTALTEASTSRVLNLLRISQAHGEDASFQANPLFTSPQLNASIIVKHRLRSDEVDLFSPPRANGTKVIVPFEKTDLRAGGKSLIVGQRGYSDMLRQICHYGEKQSLAHDMNVLELLDRIPSLDPFLLREHLRNNDVNPDERYFSISASDQQAMFQYTAAEIGRLTSMAAGASHVRVSATNRMVEAMLSNEVSDKLEPLRVTLGLDEDSFREGIFSWRGFIYYKWSLERFWPDLVSTLRHINTVQPAGFVEKEQRNYLASVRQTIIQGAKRNIMDIRHTLAAYTAAYDGLIGREEVAQFRTFLLAAPSMFLEIGEKTGSLSHMTSFWKFRFSGGFSRVMDADELIAIFQDFSKSVSAEPEAISAV